MGHRGNLQSVEQGRTREGWFCMGRSKSPEGRRKVKKAGYFENLSLTNLSVYKEYRPGLEALPVYSADLPPAPCRALEAGGTPVKSQC